jgi:hypothetical protein
MRRSTTVVVALVVGTMCGSIALAGGVVGASAPPTNPTSDPESVAELTFTGWAQGNGTPVTSAACHVGTDTTTCYGLLADNTALIATVSAADGTVSPIVVPASDVPALGCGASSAASSDPLADAMPFVDPQGSYEIEVDPDWEASHGTMVAEVEAWLVAEPSDGFAPNVNVLTQAVPGMDLDGYLDLSVAQAPAMLQDFELVRRDVVEGAANELGVMEYTGTQGGRPLHFLATVAVGDGTAIVATFTVPPEAFDDLRCEVEPFLLTLRAS